MFVNLPQLHCMVFSPLKSTRRQALTLGNLKKAQGVQKKLTSPLQHIFAPYFLFGIPKKNPSPCRLGPRQPPRCWDFLRRLVRERVAAPGAKAGDR